MYRDRLARARARMTELGVDALLLSIGPDLPYFTGYEAMPLERLTMLVVRPDEDAVLVVPRLEAPRVEARPDVFRLVTWDETDDPVALVAQYARGASLAAVGDQTWARFVLALQGALPATRFTPARDVTGPLRMAKDAAEIDALQAAAAAVDAIALEMRSRPFAGRREIDVHRELVERMLDAGHERSNFAIVAAAANSASPHHEPGTRVIADGDVVLLDFGGTMQGYCSDITRMFHVGEPAAEVRDIYAVLVEAEEAGVQAATVGTPCAAVDAAGRAVITAAGYGEYFVHRTGHGIGMEAHEDPYIVAGNDAPLEPGHAFSIEPGIYLPGRFGFRLEDIVVATLDGPRRLNHTPHNLAVVGLRTVVRLDLSSVLLQWAAGGLAFLWVTVRRAELGLGYGWLLRSSYAVIGAGGVAAGLAHGDHGAGAALRDGAGVVMVLAAVVALGVSVVHRDRGIAGFPARLDLVAPAAGLVALFGAADVVGGSYLFSLARLVVGAAFLGCITDAMLLGHWYLVQPGLARDPIKELVRIGLWLTPLEIVLMFVSPGMLDVLNGTIDDGYSGLLGWMWVVCGAATMGLLFATRAALKEPYYSAVMAATGLMYLAILTAFGTDVMARAVFGS